MRFFFLLVAVLAGIGAGHRPLGVQQGKGRGTRWPVLHRAVQPGRQFRPDPDDKARLCHSRRLAGLELEVMLIRAARQKQRWLAKITHDFGHKGMNGGNVGHDQRHLGEGWGKGGRKEGGAGKGESYHVTHWAGLSKVRGLI